MIIQIYDPKIATWAALADGIVYAADNGARAITTTTGGPQSNTPPKVLEDAVNYIVSKGNYFEVLLCSANKDILGSLLTTSGGNSYKTGNTLFCPPCYNQSIAVGGLQEDGTWWVEANTGPHIDIVAPGKK